MSFYEKYVNLCNQIGKSPSAVAIEMDMSKSTVNRWKNGGGITDANIQTVANYFGVDVEFLKNENETDENNGYYYSKETADMAQKLFDNKDLRLLFDAAQDASPEDLKTTYDMLMALKRKERGED